MGHVNLDLGERYGAGYIVLGVTDNILDLKFLRLDEINKGER